MSKLTQGLVDRKKIITGDETECPTCKSPLMPTKTGAVCPNGHHGSFRKMEIRQARLNEAIIFGVPRANFATAKRYVIDDMEGTYEKGRIFTGNFYEYRTDRDKEGRVLAILDDKIRYFTKEVKR